MSRWMTPTEHVHGVNADAASAANAPEPGTRRQVQLIAPGGTRVIWIFNADFNP
jgi:urease beta subunit